METCEYRNRIAHQFDPANGHDKIYIASVRKSKITTSSFEVVCRWGRRGSKVLADQVKYNCPTVDDTLRFRNEIFVGKLAKGYEEVENNPHYHGTVTRDSVKQFLEDEYSEVQNEAATRYSKEVEIVLENKPKRGRRPGAKISRQHSKPLVEYPEAVVIVDNSGMENVLTEGVEYLVARQPDKNGFLSVLDKFGVETIIHEQRCKA